MKINVIGSGYVGIVIGSCLAEIGCDVLCIDRDIKKITALRDGKIQLVEAGLDDLIKRNSAAGRLRFTSDTQTAVFESKLVFIAVGTPAASNGEADLTQFWMAVKELSPALSPQSTLVIKSTVPVGTARTVKEMLDQSLPDSRICAVISSPEFLSVGTAVRDFMYPKRILFGISSKRSLPTIQSLYESFVPPSTPIHIMSYESAELSKYASNAMLALRISFINEIAELSESFGADIQDVVGAVGADPRIGSHYLRPGPGFGGSCLSKDIQALICQAKRRSLQFGLGVETLKVNARQPDNVIKQLQLELGDLRGHRICLMGLTFKSGTDDIRESPSVQIARSLLSAGAIVAVYDPAFNYEANFRPRGLIHAIDPYSACDEASAIIIATDWPDFVNLDYSDIASRLNRKIIVDTRNIIDRSLLERFGFKYIGKGVSPTIIPEGQMIHKDVVGITHD